MQGIYMLMNDWRWRHNRMHDLIRNPKIIQIMRVTILGRLLCLTGTDASWTMVKAGVRSCAATIKQAVAEYAKINLVKTKDGRPREDIGKWYSEAWEYTVEF